MFSTRLSVIAHRIGVVYVDAVIVVGDNTILDCRVCSGAVVVLGHALAAGRHPVGAVDPVALAVERHVARGDVHADLCRRIDDVLGKDVRFP